MTDATRSSSEWMADRDDGIRLLDERDFAAATARLTKASAADPTGECAALLGLACYLAEDYAAAAEHYGAALEQDQQRSDWQQMLAAQPGQRPGARSTSSCPTRTTSIAMRCWRRRSILRCRLRGRTDSPSASLKRVRYLVGHAVGSIGGVVFNGLVELVGRHYHGEVWTNWYRKRLYRGILTLGYMREKLDRDNLMSTYPEGQQGRLPGRRV